MHVFMGCVSDWNIKTCALLGHHMGLWWRGPSCRERARRDTYSPLFITACQHDQRLDILLPDHPPEIFDCGRQGTLSCYKLLPGAVTLPNTTRTSPSCVNTNIRPLWFHGKFCVFQHFFKHWMVQKKVEHDKKKNKQSLWCSQTLKHEWLSTRRACWVLSTHRHVVSIDVVVIWTAMDNREFHPRRVIWEVRQGGQYDLKCQ